MKTILRLWSALAVIISVSLGLSGVVSAGHGYYVVDKNARPGMLVSLTSNPGVVEPASDKNMSSLLGVIANSETDFDVQQGQTAIQTDGTVKVLVSTLGGDITVGDHISPSYIVGIGMRNNQGGWVVGVAQSSLNSSTPGAVKTSVKDENNTPHDVYVGPINVVVKVVNYNPSNNPDTKTEATSPVPKKLQVFADSLAGKRASVIAMAFAAVLLMTGILISGYIINGTIKNGIQSIARQPLAKKSIMRGIGQTLILALAILVCTTVGAFVLIKFL